MLQLCCRSHMCLFDGSELVVGLFKVCFDDRFWIQLNVCVLVLFVESSQTGSTSHLWHAVWGDTRSVWTWHSGAMRAAGAFQAEQPMDQSLTVEQSYTVREHHTWGKLLLTLFTDSMTSIGNAGILLLGLLDCQDFELCRDWETFRKRAGFSTVV